MPRRTVVDPQFPQRLRELRKERGLSQQGLARDAHVSGSFLSELESGIKTPGVKIATALDKALQADGELVGMVTDAADLRDRLPTGRSGEGRALALVAGHVDNRDGVPVEEFMMAAEESARFMRRAGVAVTGELLDQIRTEVYALAVTYVRQPPYAVFSLITELRREVFSILDRHVPASHQTDLYLYAGQLTALLAHASADLGQPVVAQGHARAAWMCADLAGHDALRAYVRWVQANVAYWSGRYRDAAEIASEGSRHASAGSSLLRLASQEARAWAAAGDQRAVAQTLAIARDERDRLAYQADDEVGAFRFSAGKAAYYAAEAWLAAGGADNAERARDDAEEANALLTAEPQQCPELVAAAQLDLAAAQIALGDLDAAAEQLVAPLALSADRRTVPVIQRVARVHDALSAPNVAPSLMSAGLREQLRVFLAHPAIRELPN